MGSKYQGCSSEQKKFPFYVQAQLLHLQFISIQGLIRDKRFAVGESISLPGKQLQH